MTELKIGLTRVNTLEVLKCMDERIPPSYDIFGSILMSRKL